MLEETVELVLSEHSSLKDAKDWVKGYKNEYSLLHYSGTRGGFRRINYKCMEHVQDNGSVCGGRLHIKMVEGSVPSYIVTQSGQHAMQVNNKVKIKRIGCVKSNLPILAPTRTVDKKRKDCSKNNPLLLSQHPSLDCAKDYVQQNGYFLLSNYSGCRPGGFRSINYSCIEHLQEDGSSCPVKLRITSVTSSEDNQISDAQYAVMHNAEQHASVCNPQLDKSKRKYKSTDSTELTKILKKMNQTDDPHNKPPADTNSDAEILLSLRHVGCNKLLTDSSDHDGTGGPRNKKKSPTSVTLIPVAAGTVATTMDDNAANIPSNGMEDSGVLSSMEVLELAPTCPDGESMEVEVEVDKSASLCGTATGCVASNRVSFASVNTVQCLSTHDTVKEAKIWLKQYKYNFMHHSGSRNGAFRRINYKCMEHGTSCTARMHIDAFKSSSCADSNHIDCVKFAVIQTGEHGPVAI